jgi:FdhD protein
VPDRVAVEEPLQVRVDGEAFSVIMRTPGADAELTAGFLFSERLIAGAGDIDRLRPGVDRRGRLLHNVIDVTLTAAAAARPQPARRRVTTTAACGLCGRQTIESLTVDAPPLAGGWTVAIEAVLGLPATLRRAQRVFDDTGGLHAAALFDDRGRIVRLAEDVGRHNAVDKAIGHLLLERRLPLSTLGLFVSGRTSYEILQKAFLAGVPLVASVSAPSSLAVDLAQAAGITLVGFVRDGRLNAYAHRERLVGTPAPVDAAGVPSRALTARV